MTLHNNGDSLLNTLICHIVSMARLPRIVSRRVASHLSAQDNELVKVAPVLDRYGDFATFLAQEDVKETLINLPYSKTL